MPLYLSSKKKKEVNTNAFKGMAAHAPHGCCTFQ